MTTTTGFFCGARHSLPVAQRRRARSLRTRPLEKVRPRVYQMAFAKTKCCFTINCHDGSFGCRVPHPPDRSSRNASDDRIVFLQLQTHPAARRARDRTGCSSPSRAAIGRCGARAGRGPDRRDVRTRRKRVARTPLRQPQIRSGQPQKRPRNRLPDRLGLPPRRTAARDRQGIRRLAAGARRRRRDRLGPAIIPVGPQNGARPALGTQIRKTAARRSNQGKRQRTIRTSSRTSRRALSPICTPAMDAGAASRSMNTAAISSRKSSGASTRARRSNRSLAAEKPEQPRISDLFDRRTTTSTCVIFMPSGGCRQTLDADGVTRNIHQLAVALEQEMVVIRRVGIEVGLRSFDGQLADKTRPLELMQRIVNGRQRDVLSESSATSACNCSAVTCRSPLPNSSRPSVERCRVGRNPACRSISGIVAVGCGIRS